MITNRALFIWSSLRVARGAEVSSQQYVCVKSHGEAAPGNMKEGPATCPEGRQQKFNISYFEFKSTAVWRAFMKKS